MYPIRRLAYYYVITLQQLQFQIQKTILLKHHNRPNKMAVDLKIHCFIGVNN